MMIGVLRITLALLALFLIVPGARAADCPSGGGTQCDQGKAFSMCKAAIERTKAAFDRPGNQWGKPTVRTNCTGGADPLQGSYTCAVAEGPNGGAVRCMNADGDDNAQTFYYKGACSARAEQTSWKAVGGGSGSDVCNEGCRYSGSLDASSPTGITYSPTGGTCSNGEFPSPESADPGEGEGEGGGGTDPGGGGDGGGTDPGGGGGTDPGGGGGGTGPGDGDGDGDGEGGGGGGGTGPGTGPGQGDGDGDGDSAGPTTGRLYKKHGKTVAKVLAEFKASIEGAPIMSKVKGFFGDCAGGGSCPNATWDGGQYAGKFDLSSLCAGPLLSLFQFAGFVFLAGASIVALRWALL